MMNRTNISDSNTARRPAERSRPGWMASIFPEGPIVTILLLGLIATAAFSVQAGGWVNVLIPVGVIGVAAGVLGTVLAKVRIADIWAHVLMIGLGLGTILGMVSLNAESLEGTLLQRVRMLGVFVIDWYLGSKSPNEDEELLISILMGFIVWLVGYLSAWTLFRRGWLLAGVGLPSLLLLVNVGYAPSQHPWLLGVMAALSIPLCARFYLYQRQRVWEYVGMPSPVSLGARFLILSTVLSVLVTGASWQTPAAWSQTAVQPLIKEISGAMMSAQDRAADWLDQATATRPDVADAGSYSAFDDAFSVGGPLELSDEPEVLVQTNRAEAPYLTAHHYDTYTGRGWASGLESQFDSTGPDGQRYAPELMFREGQSVVLSPDVTGERFENTSTITPLSGDPGVVLSVDTYLTASIQTVVRMSWQQLQNEPFFISADGLTQLPPDIQLISNLLLQSELTGDAGDHGMTSADADMQDRIDRELESLTRRLIAVRWIADDQGAVQTLYVSGQLPVYDDVEAVFPRDAQAVGALGSYQVTGLTSTADPEMLADAGGEYPGWVTDRYLQMSEAVTPRTIDLAFQIASGAANPYEQAVAIERYLRTNITYDERVDAPPDGADVVDHVLFEDSRGYCEHYSSAMTVMMRALGIPARTVVGYYPGDYDDSQGGFLYRQLNAHAWTEVFFPGYGWIAFEPTANRDLDERDISLEGPAETEVPTPEQEVVPTPDDAVEADATPAIDERSFENPGPAEMSPVEDANGASNWIAPALGGMVLLGLFCAGLMLAWNWRLRGLPPSAALFTRLVRIGKLTGVRTNGTTTPREYASAFSRSVPAAGPPVKRIVQAYEMDQYGPEGVDEGGLERAKVAWRQVRSLVPRMLLRRRNK